MNGKAEAVAHGAATIVNAIATGRGAAVGVDLWTRAKVEITSEPRIIEGKIKPDETESTILIEKTVNRVFKHFGLEHKLGAKVETQSNIPIAKGLKSSSAAANAIALATVAALDKKLDDFTIVNLGVDAAFDAKVTITGAFDDACASYFGGVILTDNIRRKIVKQFEISDDLAVLFHVPPRKVYTSSSNVNRMKSIAPLVKIAYKQAWKGNYWIALTLNGLMYASALGYDPTIAIDALMAGASAAGLSGTGPATAAIVSAEKKDLVRQAWQSYGGEIIEAKINREKARVIG